MHILLATDNNFVQHCCVTMTSVLKNNKNVIFHIFTEGLTPNNERVLLEQVQRYNGELYFHLIDSEVIKNFPMPAAGGLHISIATYYRLFAEIVLPSNINRVIYMDCDMIVRSSFDELWNVEMDGYALGAVFQPDNEYRKKEKERLMIEDGYGYFNAGLLIMNLDYWRKYNVTNRLFDFITKYKDRIKQHDQDTLNAVLYKETMAISYTWNYLPLFMEKKTLSFPSYVDYREKIYDPANIHFVSVPKPWDFGCTHPYRKEYYNYLEMTPFAGAKPIFVWKKFYTDVLKRRVILFIAYIDVLNLRKLFKHNTKQ